MKSDSVKPNRRAARPMRGSRAKAYPRDELLAATIAHAEATITKARGVGPHENELAMFRNYAMSHANFEQTEQAEKMARRANSDLSKGYNLLLKGIQEALSLDPLVTSSVGSTLAGEPILIGTRPAKSIRPAGFAAALSFNRFILQAALNALEPLGHVVARLETLKPDPPIELGDAILHDLDRPNQRGAHRQTELAAWSFLARGALPDLFDVSYDRTPKEVLDAERRALKARARRKRRPDPIHGSAFWGTPGPPK